MNKCTVFFIACCLLTAGRAAAQDVRIHSHNDYDRDVPFFQAYLQQAASIEADIFATGREDELLVAHNAADLPSAPSLDEAYLRPLVDLFRRNGGRAWKNSDRQLILLVDLKTPFDPALKLLVDKLQRHPDVFDPGVNPHAVRVVISGDRPPAEAFERYPAFIFFDGAHTDYSSEQLERIGMISFSLGSFTRWDGAGRLSPDDYRALCKAIDAAHALGKPIRFWGTPDSPVAWSLLHQLGTDFINTDRPEACTRFFRELKHEK
ncbi:MAG: phosphatidylinositol-specific phospholipase C/glycerophosphodiester phosphodiesterase family protein [Tannerella sp.]|jgi:alkaline phosphatase|nr:phosphatidylinositol-specific phospholipase C/glycerophosphodiester phosphodiesterase family protein [Tannerella sp.]